MSAAILRSDYRDNAQKRFNRDLNVLRVDTTDERIQLVFPNHHVHIIM